MMRVVSRRTARCVQLRVPPAIYSTRVGFLSACDVKPDSKKFSRSNFDEVKRLHRSWGASFGSSSQGSSVGLGADPEDLISKDPEELMESFRQKVKIEKPHIVLPEAIDPRIVSAARMAADSWAKVTLLCREGDLPKVKDAATEAGVEISDIPLFEVQHHPDYAKFVSKLEMTRAGKKMPDTTDPLVFANMMVKNGAADGSVAGAITSSGDTVRSAIQVVGLAQGQSIISSFFLMISPLNGPMIFSDCAVNPNPTSEQLADIAYQAAQSHKALFPDLEQRVALLSFSTKGSAKHPDVEKVTDALDILKVKHPDLNVDGEMQFDAAMVPSVGASKAPKSNVAGRANVFVFPNLDAGNIGYKIAQRVGGAKAIGPVLQGAAMPCNDLSRGCSAKDVEETMIITGMQAVEMKRASRVREYAMKRVASGR